MLQCSISIVGISSENYKSYKKSSLQGTILASITDSLTVQEFTNGEWNHKVFSFTPDEVTEVSRFKIPS